MARTAKTPISPIAAQEIAAAYLSQIGAVQPSYSTIYDFVPGKPIRLRGKRRDGQHKGHRCSQTSSGGTKKKGN